MKIVTIVGARPQFIKAAALSRELRKEHEEILVHTGQHYDSNMSDVFFEEMEIPAPKYNLGVSGGSHAKMTANMLIEIEKVLVEEKPDAVLLYGDTNSTLAGALTAAKLLIPIIHIEAGNRLGTLTNPEEVNRITTDHLSSLLICSTETSKENLDKEGLSERSFVAGNIMYDSFLHFANKEWIPHTLLGLNGEQVEIPENFYYMTCHRQENSGEKELKEIFDAMECLEYPTIYPVHPRNKSRAMNLVNQFNYKKIILLDAVKYSDSVYLVKNAKKVVTDSGGLQCEAFYAKTQCVFVLDYVVWPETLVGNRNQLAKPDKQDILEKLSKEQVIDENYKPFGDGNSAAKICEIIRNFDFRLK